MYVCKKVIFFRCEYFRLKNSPQNLVGHKTCHSLIFITFNQWQKHICYSRHPKSLQEYDPDIPDILQFCFSGIVISEHLWFNYMWTEGADRSISNWDCNLFFKSGLILRKLKIGLKGGKTGCVLFICFNQLVHFMEEKILWAKGGKIAQYFDVIRFFKSGSFLAGNCFLEVNFSSCPRPFVAAYSWAKPLLGNVNSID